MTKFVSSSALNEAQQRSLRIGCEHIDSLLKSVEDVLHATESSSVFPRYVDNLRPVQHKTIEDYVARVREQLLRVLAGQGLQPEKPRITASHAVYTTLTFVLIAIEEMAPDKMRGYGMLSETAAADLHGIVQELHSLVQQMLAYALQGERQDIASRISELQLEGREGELLRTLEEIITRRGLVEYRTTLATLLERLEERSFEIAIFGRVSSGKSSLLNHIIGTDILPVGVTPITAIPTRVAYGPEPSVEIRIEGLGPHEIDLTQLPEYVDERRNPSNKKRVAKLLVRYPSERLREGVVLVDTPGLGSLATSGARETMAYLPRCDMGVVLIDAASTLSLEDLKVIRALANGDIPTTVVLSKSDLLRSEDLDRMRAYVQSHIRSEFGLDIECRPVSAMPDHANLLEGWFRDDIVPLYEQRQQLRRESIWRKTLTLQSAVEAALKAELSADKAPGNDPEEQGVGQEKLLEAEKQLRRASGVLQSIRPDLRRTIDQVAELGTAILEKSAHEVSQKWSRETEVDVDEVLWTTASKAMIELGARIHERIALAVSELRVEMDRTSQSLGESPSPIEEIMVRGEMPVFHMNRVKRIASKPLAERLLGSKALVWRAKSELEPLRPALEVALVSYGALLRGWSEVALQQVERQFDLNADRQRAALGRLLAEKPALPLDEASLRGDLAMLQEAVGTNSD